MHAILYPPPRERPERGAPKPGAVEVYERYESNGETTLTDTMAEVITFSGFPDSIVLTARTFNAIVELTDRLNRETHTILVPAGTSIETRIRRDRVRARNAVAASNAILNAVGKWAAKGE